MRKTRFIHTTRQSKRKLLVIIVASRVEHRKKTRGPTPLYKIDKQNLINKQIELLNILNGEIIVSLGILFDKVVNQLPENIRVVENLFFDSTNDVEDIRLGLNNFKSDSLLVIDGAVLPSKSGLSKINFEESSVIVSQETDFVSVFEHDNYVTNFHYDKNNKSRWSSIAYFTGQEFKLFKQLCCRENNNKIVHELMNEIINQSGKFKVITDNKTVKL